MKNRAVILGLVGLIVCVAIASHGQVTSRLTGVVQDKSGAVIAGAAVTLTNEATSVSFTTTTTNAGTYVFDGVKPGTYRVTIVMKGFKTFSSPGNVVSIGQPTTVNALLDVGATEEKMEVSAAAELVQTATSGNISTLVDLNMVATLPIVGTRGRNPLELVELTPGVVDAGGFNQGGPNVQGGGVHVNGARDRAWNYTLDGIDINETSAGGGNFSPLRTNPDMLSEFRVVTSNFTSEYGRNSGAQVEMVSKSGTNQFHGTGFFFYQTPRLMANDPANKEAGLPRPQWVQKIPGFSFGGPIIKNKTFFFANFQWLRTLKTQAQNQLVYTQQARQGILRYVTQTPGCIADPEADGCRNTPANSPGASVDTNGNVLPGVGVTSYNVASNDPQHMGLDASVLKLLNGSPLPNNFTSGDGLNTAGFSWLAAEHEQQLDYSIRVDHTFNDKHTIFGRWSGGHQNTVGDTANGGLAVFPGSPNVVDTYRTPKNLAVSWRYAISQRMLNELTIGMNRFGFNFANPDPNYQQNPAFNFWATSGVAVPLQNYVGNARYLTTMQLVDNFSYQRGGHAFKWGLNFRYGRHIDNRGSIGNLDAAPAINFDPGWNDVGATFNLPTTINPVYDVGSLKGSINDLLGRVGEIDQGIVALNKTNWAPPYTNLRADFRMPEYDFYFQDSWRVRPNLTVDLGLRWEINLSPRVTVADNMLRPNPPLGWGNTSNTLSWMPGQLYRDYKKNLGPSIGFAWDPKGNGKMSIRANYRLAYDRINTFSLSSAVFQGFPGLTQQVVDTSFGEAGGRLSQLSSSVLDSVIASHLAGTPQQLRTPAAFSNASITVVDPTWRPPQTHMWSLGFQRELPGKMLLEVDYLGRKGQHLYGAYNANAVKIANNGFMSAFNTVKGGGDSALIDQLLAADTRKPTATTGSVWMSTPGSPYYSAYSQGSVASVAAAMANRNLPALANMSPFFFLNYPQFAGGFIVLDSHDRSFYNALQTSVRRSYSNGLTFQASWVWSKSLDTRSWDPTFSTVATASSPWGASSTPWDLDNRKLNYAPSDFDRTHVFQSIWVYELPFGKDKKWGHSWNGFFDRVLSGWEISGFGILESGRPTTVYGPAYTVSNVVRTPANCNGCSPHMFSIHRDPDTGLLTYLTPNQVSMFSSPAPGQFSNVGRNYFRLAGYKNLSMSIGKKTKLTERQQLELRLEIQNVFNSVQYDEPASNLITSSGFGILDPQILVIDYGRGLTSDPRKMQVSVKYSF